MNSKPWIKIVRWVAVLPVAILGFILGGFFANIFFDIQQWFLGINSNSGWGQINYWIFSSAASAVASVYFGAKIAPSGRKVVSLILGAIVVIVSTFAFLIAISEGKNEIWTALASLSSMIGAGVIVYGFFEEGDEFSLSD